MGGIGFPRMVTDPQQMFAPGPFPCGLSSCVSLSTSHAEGEVDSLE